ncbi:MAG: hypothetical protein Ct9H300mP6_07530 [Gammaproteobacteria bacterium]|nr:MAG: hypothetical protein Ct9H300mP6_07530 [Gammaproteobacteria bacterium]
MQGEVKEIRLVACAFEFNFLGGSMGSVVGEKFVRAVNLSIRIRFHWFVLLPAVVQDARSFSVPDAIGKNYLSTC